jgi:hypothetical protein
LNDAQLTYLSQAISGTCNDRHPAVEAEIHDFSVLAI